MDMSKRILRVHDINFRYIEDSQMMMKKIKHFEILMQDDMEKHVYDIADRVEERLDYYTVDRVDSMVTMPNEFFIDLQQSKKNKGRHRMINLMHRHRMIKYEIKEVENFFMSSDLIWIYKQNLPVFLVLCDTYFIDEQVQTMHLFNHKTQFNKIGVYHYFDWNIILINDLKFSQKCCTKDIDAESIRH